MTTAAAVTPYEDEDLLRTTGGAIRPGGTALTDQAVELAGLRAGDVVVDIGCGTGGTLARLADHHGVQGIGVDPSAVLLGRARRPGLGLLRGRAQALPLRDGVADAVLAECVLSLVPEPAVALAEFARVLRPGGRLVLTDLYARDAAGTARLRDLPPTSCLHGVRALPELLGLLRDTGLRVRAMQDHTPALTALAVRLVWMTGSADRLWCPSGQATRAQVTEAVHAARPGYVLLLAQTPGG